MILHVISDTGEYLGRLNSFISLTWKEEYQGKGRLAMYCYDNDDTAKLLRQGYILYRADRRTAMEIVRIDRNDQTRQIYVGGYSTLNLLNRRVMTEEYEANVGESSVYGMVAANLRDLPVLNAAEKGYTEALGETVTYKNKRLYDAIMDVCEGTGLGARMTYDPDTKKHTLEVYKGTDHTADSAQPYIASAEFGNLQSLSTSEDDDYYRNTCVVTGTLTGGQTVWVRVYAYEGLEDHPELQREAILDSGLVQREAVTEQIVDTTWSDNWWSSYANQSGSNAGSYSGGYKTIQAAETGAEFAERLCQAGMDKLKEYTQTKSFDAQIDASDYGTLYALGDLITCKSTRYGMEFDARVSSVTEKEEAGNHTISVVLGEPDTDAITGGILLNG